MKLYSVADELYVALKAMQKLIQTLTIPFDEIERCGDMFIDTNELVVSALRRYEKERTHE